MISIAVCDDNVEIGRKIAEKVQCILKAKKLVFEVQLFSDSQFLFYEIQDGTNFDLLLLDIEMPEIDGISLTNKIKEILPNCLIIFITSHDKYVFDSFKVQPFRYIPKRYIKDRLPEAVLEATMWIEKSNCRYYPAENQQGMERIYIVDIGYVWHKGKYAYIEKLNGECVKVRKTLKQVFEELPVNDFVWLDRGCICNLSRIVKVEGSDAILSNDRKLQISRDRLTEVKNQIRKYWLEKREG